MKKINLTKKISVLTIGFIISSFLFSFRPAYPGYKNESPLKQDRNAGTYVPDELIVKFKSESNNAIQNSLNPSPSDISSINGLNKKHNVTAIEQVFKSNKKLSKGVNSPDLSGVYKIKVPKGRDITEVISDYTKDPNVEYAEPNYTFTIDAVTPNDPNFSSQWGLNNTGQSGGRSDADIDAPEGWVKSTGDANVVIAVVDTGVDYTHADLYGNIWINSGEDINSNGVVDGTDFNGIDDDGNGYIDDIRGYDFVSAAVTDVAPGEDPGPWDNDPRDVQGHGTHVSGIAAAMSNNSIGIAGTSWNSKIMAVRAGFKGSDGNGYLLYADSAQALVYAADNGADVINMSWGGSTSSSLIRDAVSYAYAQGVVLVAAAGNNGNSSMHYPSGYDEVISVAATDHNDTIASFSTYGEWVDVFAPGVNILSTIPGNSYASWNGTSMASPYVAGLSALIIADNPGRSMHQIKNLILSGGDTILSAKKTLTDKRINIEGTLNCLNRYLFSVVNYPLFFEVGAPVTLSAISINCENGAGPVTVTDNDNNQIELYDNGISPDTIAGDGMFNGILVPSSNLTSLTFSFPGGNTIVKDVQLLEWVRTYEGGSVDLARDVEIDIDGNVYVTGDSVNSGTSNDFLTMKYDSQGNLLWQKTYNLGTDQAYGIAVDYNSNVYVAGRAASLLAVIKYDSYGNTLWSRTYDFGNAYLLDIVADNEGNIIATGQVSTNQTDMITIKFNSSGDIIWSRTYHRGSNDNGRGVTVDAQNNIYVTGMSFNGSNYDCATIKYNSAGDEIWRQIFDTGVNIDDRCYDISLDFYGNIYLAGGTYSKADSIPVNSDYLLLKYNPAGGLIWKRTYNRIRYDEANSITVDIMGDIYVTGKSSDGSSYDMLTIKYDPNGNQKRTIITNLTDEVGSGVAVDNFDGAIVVAGNYYTDPNPTLGSNRDYLIIKYRQTDFKRLTSITITPYISSVILGQTQQFTATGAYQNGDIADITGSINWGSSNLSAATIDLTGLATGIGIGSANITAEFYGISGGLAIIDVTNNLTAIDLTPLNISMLIGGSRQFTATGVYENGDITDITGSVNWTSSNSSVATINSTGLATGVGAGSTNITASLNGVTSSPAVINVTISIDLIMTSISAPSSIPSGMPYPISSTVKNQGLDNAVTGFYVGVYLSTDATINTSDILIGNRFVSSLSAGISSVVTTSVNIPRSYRNKNYYIGVIADYTNTEIEINETNNARTGPRVRIK